MTKFEIMWAKFVIAWEKLPRFVHIYIYGGMSILVLILIDAVQVIDVSNVYLFGYHLSPEVLGGLMLYTVNNVLKVAKDWLFNKLGSEVIVVR